MVTASLHDGPATIDRGMGPADLVARSIGVSRPLLSADGGRGADLDRFLSGVMFHDARYAFGNVDRDEFIRSIARTGVGYLGSGPGGYGLTLPFDQASRVIDRARALSAVWGLCRWQPVRTRGWLCPINGETSRATGSRFGGLKASFGMGELNMPAATDGKVGRQSFKPSRCLLFTTVSTDVFDDAEALDFWLQESAYKEIAATLENVVINGAVGGPTGLINNAATVTVAKGSTGAGAITAANLDSLWQALPESDTYTSCWLMNKKTLGYLDSLSGQGPELIQYYPAPMTGGSWPTLKSKPVILSEFCPDVGTPGDVILWNPRAFLFAYMPLTELSRSPLAWNVGIDYVAVNDVKVDPLRTGLLAFPDGALEQRISPHLYFNLDELACCWKLRIDFNSIWTGTVTGVDGGTYGPCAVVAQR